MNIQKDTIEWKRTLLKALNNMPAYNILATSYAGFKLYENPHMTIPGEPYEVPRTWKQRAFGDIRLLFKKTTTVIPQIPDPKVVIVNQPFIRCIVGHPETIILLKKKFDPLLEG